MARRTEQKGASEGFGAAPGGEVKVTQTTVLIVGGYGVFGGYLAKSLADALAFNVIVAGRNRAKADTFCSNLRASSAHIDLAATDLARRIATLAPDIVVDAAGPFQAYGKHPYALIQASVAAGAHYLDLSDDADFTLGVSRFDSAAKSANVAVLSGVSSVPALSSAAVIELAQPLSNIETIDMAILPGNRAPRGLSVMRAILGQVGHPMSVWQHGRWTNQSAWSGTKRMTLSIEGRQPLRGRYASFIGAPDLKLFPDVFQAQTVTFRAGLELGLMHRGLEGLSWLVRLGLVKSLSRYARPMKWISDRLESAGSDRGGMVVTVTGVSDQVTRQSRTWTLIAEAGNGPQIPAVPARILCDKLRAGEVPAGARPCIGAFTLLEAEHHLGDLSIATGITTTRLPTHSAAQRKGLPRRPWFGNSPPHNDKNLQKSQHETGAHS